MAWSNGHNLGYWATLQLGRKNTGVCPIIAGAKEPVQSTFNMGCSSEKNLGSVLDLFIFGSLIWGLQRLTIYAGSKEWSSGHKEGMLIGLIGGTGIHPALMQSRLLRLLQHWPAAVVLRAIDNWGQVEHPTNSIQSWPAQLVLGEGPPFASCQDWSHSSKKRCQLGNYFFLVDIRGKGWLTI